MPTSSTHPNAIAIKQIVDQLSQIIANLKNMVPPDMIPPHKLDSHSHCTLPADVAMRIGLGFAAGEGWGDHLPVGPSAAEQRARREREEQAKSARQTIAFMTANKDCREAMVESVKDILEDAKQAYDAAHESIQAFNERMARMVERDKQMRDINEQIDHYEKSFMSEPPEASSLRRR